MQQQHFIYTLKNNESGISLCITAIFDIDIHPIPSACDRHYDIGFLLQADKDAEIKLSEESNDLAWIPLEEIPNYSQDRSILRKAKKYKELVKTGILCL